MLVGDDETEAELHAQHEKLKQQLSSKQQSIQDLKSKIKELKEEGIYMHTAHASL